MEKLKTFCLVMLAICSISCSKDNNVSDINYDDSIIGNWKWVKTDGGISGAVITPENSHFNLYYTFNSTTLISKSVESNNTVVDTFNFIYQKDFSYILNDSTFMIKINHLIPADSTVDYKMRSIVEFKIDTMIIADDFVDGQSKYFVRIK